MSVAVPSHAGTRRAPAVARPASVIALADLDEATVIERAVAGDREAFGELYRRYRPVVFRFVLSKIRRDPAEAEDITSEVFISAMKTIGSYRSELKPFRNWIFRVTRRRLFEWRESRVRVEVPEAEIDLGIDLGWSGKPETIVLDRVEVLDLLANLPTRLRQVLVLRFAYGLPAPEVARLMRAFELKTSYVERTSAVAVLRLTKQAMAALDERRVAQEKRDRVRRFLADPTATWQPLAPAADTEAA